jgi:hypothetical protein
MKVNRCLVIENSVSYKPRQYFLCLHYEATMRLAWLRSSAGERTLSRVFPRQLGKLSTSFESETLRVEDPPRGSPCSARTLRLSHPLPVTMMLHSKAI